jgi:hypothetical protein
MHALCLLADRVNTYTSGVSSIHINEKDDATRCIDVVDDTKSRNSHLAEHVDDHSETSSNTYAWAHPLA